MTWDMLIAVIGALGGLEFVKFFMYRKQNSRVEEAKADDAELDVLIKHQEFSDKQLSEKDRQIQDWEQRYSDNLKRYDEQTERLRKTQDDLLTAQRRIGELELLYQHAHLWECQLGDCRKRKPANPLLWGVKYSPYPNEQKQEQQQ